MHHNQTGLYTNSLSSHASLLLSASPTIITSPLQNNTSNPQNSPHPLPVTLTRRQPSTPLVTASNLDNDSHINTESPSNTSLTDGYINFKKPQNEMFKKLDGKIQKIVAAHSNLNKLYALNDFSSLGVGPKRPFELPPQLPRPPPWVPKVVAEYGSPWHQETEMDATSSGSMSHIEVPTSFKSTSGLFDSKSIMKTPVKHCLKGGPFITKSSSLTLDSAISKLHHRRQQQQQSSRDQAQQPLKHHQLNKTHIKNHTVDQDNRLSSGIPIASTSSNIQSTPTITSAQNELLKINKQISDATKDVTDCLFDTQAGAQSSEEKRKFQEDLIAILKREINAVTKAAKLKFSPFPEAECKGGEQKSLLMKSSPQSLFNTIRHETSLLLNKRQPQVNRSSLSLLSDQRTFKRQNAHVSTQNRPQINRPETIKVIVPPTQLHSGLKFDNYLDRESPQPNTEMITIEQFAKCLNLVRSNDTALQGRHDRLQEAEIKWRLLMGRPLRLNRLRGHRLNVPASASYRATRKAGLQ